MFAATDGCFGYTPSPMEFEYMVMDSITQSKSPAEFEHILKANFMDVTGDDFAFACMSFRYINYDNLNYSAQQRVQQLESQYIFQLRQGRTDELVHLMWEQYKLGYERFLAN